MIKSIIIDDEVNCIESIVFISGSTEIESRLSYNNFKAHGKGIKVETKESAGGEFAIWLPIQS